MMSHKEKRDLQQKICADFGADLDSEVCKEVGDFMEQCPECRVYYDTITRSVKLYRIVEEDEQVPEEVSERLYKCLDLDKLDEE
jgi:predicted anti-sigma-YlaC factor YlaD